jgi:hypothetical protein
VQFYKSVPSREGPEHRCTTSPPLFRRRASERARDRREGVPTRRIALDPEDVDELRELANHLLEALVLAHEEQHDASRRVVCRQAHDAVDVEEPAVKEAATFSGMRRN